MDNYTLYLIKNDGAKHNITSIVGNLKWEDSIETLGVRVDFSVVRNQEDKYLVNYDLVEIGDKIIKYNNNIETFRGIITDVTTNRYSKDITAFDYAFYLNKSKTIIQFYKSSANKSIEKICEKFGVKVVVPNMATLITKIYKDNTVAEVISDILKQVKEEIGKKYFYEMVQDTLYIREQGFETIQATYQPAVNVQAFNVLDAIGNITKTESIQEMKNSILVVSDEEKSTQIIASAKDNANIGKFGLLQDVMSVDKKDSAKANNIAKNKLKELNRIGEDITIDLLGNNKIKCGRLLDLNVTDYGVIGKYLIKTSQHTYQNSIHKCSITVKKVI
ncbi:XkdQ/YqbQ family protein [Tepidibacter mesophilus]|uniref:XkdQ/YqbQ family protein n=1 Tax=Tepidibacter mesophilus TaxID=655607 RepID=UPI000C06A059|nr:hypothetical protein [Tepidibacter mesophilus]